MSKNRNNIPIQNPIAKVEHFSGPLPHPDILAKYESVVPGAAERIIKRFEIQSDHRQNLENMVVKADILKSNLGLLFGFIITMTAIIGGLYTAFKGHPFFGSSVTFVGLAFLVGAFVSNKYSPNNQINKQNKKEL